MLISDLKLLVRFADDSLYEDVTQTNLSVLGTSTTPVVTSSGYQLQDDQYFKMGNKTKEQLIDKEMEKINGKES